MLFWSIIACVTLAVAGVGWYCLAGVRVKVGWQNGDSPLAKWLDARRREKFNSQLPRAIATMTNALRAGFSISQAFDSVVQLGESPISEEFAIVQQQVRIGMGFEQALESLQNRVGSEDLTLVTTAILISRKTGGNVTEIFDRISETIRGRMRIARKVKSLTAQGRLQGVIVSLMPLFLGVIMTVLKPRMMLPFLTSAMGIAAIVAMLVLIGLGWLMIRKIVKIDI